MSYIQPCREILMDVSVQNCSVVYWHGILVGRRSFQPGGLFPAGHRRHPVLFVRLRHTVQDIAGVRNIHKCLQVRNWQFSHHCRHWWCSITALHVTTRTIVMCNIRPACGTYKIMSCVCYIRPTCGTYVLRAVHTSFVPYIRPSCRTYVLHAEHTSYVSYVRPTRGTCIRPTCGTVLHVVHSLLRPACGTYVLRVVRTSYVWYVRPTCGTYVIRVVHTPFVCMVKLVHKRTFFCIAN